MTETVQAVYPDMKSARAAVSALEAAGVEAADISLTGPDVERARTKTDTRKRDVQVTRFVGRRTAIAAAVGAAVGAGAGWLVGATTSGGTSRAVAGALAGVLIGGVVGGLLGGVGAIDVTPEWELTFESNPEGRVVVSVHTHEPDDVRRALGVFDDHPPALVRRLDAGGRPLA